MKRLIAHGIAFGAAIGLCLLLSPQSVKASPVFFAANFSGPTLSPNLQDPDGAYTLAGGAIRRSSSTGDADRHYISTVSTDYNTVDFIAELTFTLSNTGTFNVHFFGLGSGVPDPTNFNEPGDALFFRLHPLDVPNPPARGTILAAASQAGTGTLESQQLLGIIATPNSTHRARIAKLGNQVTFSLDENFSGTFAADMQTTISDLAATAPFLNSSNSRIFFGTGLTIDEFDDLSITSVPVPAAVWLFGSGLMGLLAIARKRIKI